MKKIIVLLIVFGTLLGLYFALADLALLNNTQQHPPQIEREELEDHNFNYQVKECSVDKFRSSDSSSISEIEYEVVGNTLQVKQQLNYVCCADIRLEKKLVDNTIKVYEKNAGGMCKCLCTYPVSFDIGGLTSDHYTLQLYGISYEEYEHDYSLLNEINFQVD